MKTKMQRLVAVVLAVVGPATIRSTAVRSNGGNTLADRPLTRVLPPILPGGRKMAKTPSRLSGDVRPQAGRQGLQILAEGMPSILPRAVHAARRTDATLNLLPVFRGWPDGRLTQTLAEGMPPILPGGLHMANRADTRLSMLLAVGGWADRRLAETLADGVPQILPGGQHIASRVDTTMSMLSTFRSGGDGPLTETLAEGMPPILPGGSGAHAKTLSAISFIAGV